MCPVYTLTLVGDGSVRWNGEIFVERLGHRTGSTNPDGVKRVISFARKVGFFGWDSEYREHVTDAPGTRITITLGPDERHSVFQYATDKPREFWTLATLIDGVSVLVDWDPRVE